MTFFKMLVIQKKTKGSTKKIMTNKILITKLDSRILTFLYSTLIYFPLFQERFRELVKTEHRQTNDKEQMEE